eukprot:15316056-Alexandrium_andersonii.AAC.1
MPYERLSTRRGSSLPKGSGGVCRAWRATTCSWSRVGAPVSGSAAGGGRPSTMCGAPRISPCT